MFFDKPGKGASRTSNAGKRRMPGKKYVPGKTGEPPNRARSPQRERLPGRVPQEGDTRKKKIMTQPPKIITEVYRNGQWVLQPEKPRGQGRKPGKPGQARKGMDLNDAIRGMQRNQPWN
jgi:hypothetical protein